MAKYEEDEIKEVERVLRSGNVNFWTGSVTKSFEKEFSKFFCNCKFAYRSCKRFISSFCAYLAIGIKKDDEIITTPRTFVALPVVLLCLEVYLFLQKLIKFWKYNCRINIEPLINKKTKAIVVVH